MAAMRVAAFGDHSEMVEVGRAGASSPTQVTQCEPAASGTRYHLLSSLWP